jgi:phosphoadenosine phosphosulfate reductase
MNTALAFSGGKDSWACLWLNEYRLDEILVIWVNTGKNYPELLEQTKLAQRICPNFVEVKTDRDSQNIKEGLPSDVVPIDWTSLGQEITGIKKVKIQSYLQCCNENISKHINKTVDTYGIKRLITGQRIDESHKYPVKDKDIVNGVEHLHPIENWTKQEVMDYLKSKMEIPAHFSLNHSSLDCYDCTAYRKESNDRVEFTKINHPNLYAEYKVRMDLVDNAINKGLSYD